MNPLVCVPTDSQVHAITMASVFRTCATFPGPIGFQTFVAKPVAHARNLCVQHFLGGDWTHLFFVDSDIELPDDGLLRLLAADAPVASGLYPLQRPVAGLCLSAAVETSPGEIQFINRRPEYATPADSTRMGCCLIRRDVLEATPAPWFRGDRTTADGTAIAEDVDFFAGIRDELGVRPVIVPEVFCGHHQEVDLGAIWQESEALALAIDQATSDAPTPGATTELEPTSPITASSITEVAPATSIPGIPAAETSTATTAASGAPAAPATPATPAAPIGADARRVLAAVDELTGSSTDV